MYRTYGSLALQVEPQATRNRAVPAAPRPAPRTPAAGRTRRPAADPRPVRAAAPAVRTPNALRSREDAVRRREALRRIRRMACTYATILAIAGVLGYMVYRQAIVMQCSYAVAQAEDRIRALNADTQVVREQIASGTDLERIRTLAIERLGMQDPATRQLVRVDLPQSDRLVLGDAPSVALTSVETDPDRGDPLLEGAMDDLEGFFRTLR